MSTVSGRWKLTQSAQSELLRAMGRKKYEIDIIDKADEIFKIFHFSVEPRAAEAEHTAPAPGACKLVTQIASDITLNHKLIKLIATFRPGLRKVAYQHLFRAGEHVELKDDQKGFGACRACCTAPRSNAVHIEWSLANGTLAVDHALEGAELVVTMQWTGHDGKPPTVGIKRYRRIEWEPADEALVREKCASAKNVVKLL